MRTMITTEINAALEELKGEFTKTTDFLAEEQQDLKTAAKETDTKIKLLEQDNAKLSHDLAELGQRLRNMENVSRGCNLEIQALPETKQENLLQILKKITTEIGVTLVDSNIINIRRIAKMNPKSDRPRSILLSLSSVLLRDSVISAYKKYNKLNKENPLDSEILGIDGLKGSIFLVEHLSQETKELHTATRNAAKKLSFKYVWVTHGRVYLRKDEDSSQIQIKNISDLDKLVA